jgi:hypothetical protein
MIRDIKAFLCPLKRAQLKTMTKIRLEYKGQLLQSLNIFLRNDSKRGPLLQMKDERVSRTPFTSCLL